MKNDIDINDIDTLTELGRVADLTGMKPSRIIARLELLRAASKPED